ncbi:MAG: hypothetical protein ABJZ55_08280 [Fuerstiella sp.]
MNDIRGNLRIMLGVIMIYLFNKFALRPHVLNNQLSGLIKTIAFSLPNFCEAVCGTILLTNIALVANTRLLSPQHRFGLSTIYFTTTSSAAVYVILQELKIHNLGGRNVYDVHDLEFSVIGLTLTLCYLLIKQPRYTEEMNT